MILFRIARSLFNQRPHVIKIRFLMGSKLSFLSRLLLLAAVFLSCQRASMASTCPRLVMVAHSSKIKLLHEMLKSTIRAPQQFRYSPIATIGTYANAPVRGEDLFKELTPDELKLAIETMNQAHEGMGIKVRMNNADNIYDPKDFFVLKTDDQILYVMNTFIRSLAVRLGRVAQLFVSNDLSTIDFNTNSSDLADLINKFFIYGYQPAQLGRVRSVATLVSDFTKKDEISRLLKNYRAKIQIVSANSGISVKSKDYLTRLREMTKPLTAELDTQLWPLYANFVASLESEEDRQIANVIW